MLYVRLYREAKSPTTLMSICLIVAENALSQVTSVADIMLSIEIVLSARECSSLASFSATLSLNFANVSAASLAYFYAIFTVSSPVFATSAVRLR
jgi:hypothetical protein